MPADGALFGVNLDLGSRSLADYAQDLGHRAAVSVSFTGFPYDSRGHDYLLQAAEQIRASGRTMLLTLEPEEGLGAVTDEAARTLAADLHEINETGVPVVPVAVLGTDIVAPPGKKFGRYARPRVRSCGLISPGP